MDILIQILVTGLTLGAMYALASVGLALIFGTLGMFNMAHGLFMTIGAYAAFSLSGYLGLVLPVGLLIAMAAGALIGVLTHLLIVRFMLTGPNFETNVMVATAGLAILLQDVLLKIFGAYPFTQPVKVEGTIRLAGVAITLQSVVIVAVALVLISAIAFLLLRTRFGMTIRATAMNREAAELMGVRTTRVYLQVMGLAGALAGAAGLMISSLTTLSPQMGGDPLLKAFVICVVAGLGNVWGAGICAFALGLLEATVQFEFGVRFGFPVMLLLVILVLVWRPQGLFGRERVVRL
ncbi:branched-chain amino acid ABC transporter permease [Oricola nitratireducens]|uniref:branched-chain amino acid ABC transporter permease n=1 Tax=Oricola nitratireducens TaxID=2775868 RepID=UPI0018664168|nr:branched-chain amino acid ABC transporter permease [Oricola nitratireducens]